MDKNYKFSKKDGGPIDQGDAVKWIEKYKAKHKDGIHAYFFGTDIIRKIIDNPEAVGMRIYFAYGDEDKTQMVLIGAREDGSNIWPSLGKDGGGGTVADNGMPCPPYC
jgi:hypothetical protein